MTGQHAHTHKLLASLYTLKGESERERESERESTIPPPLPLPPQSGSVLVSTFLLLSINTLTRSSNFHIKKRRRRKEEEEEDDVELVKIIKRREGMRNGEVK